MAKIPSEIPIKMVADLPATLKVCQSTECKYHHLDATLMIADCKFKNIEIRAGKCLQYEKKTD